MQKEKKYPQLSHILWVCHKLVMTLYVKKDMWGISTFDQLNCRIQFKDSAYQGLYTPPSEKPYIE